MNIFCIGDVCGTIGCDTVSRILPSFKKLKAIDLCVANGENSADGDGVTPASADRLFSAGVDVITGGNHTFKRREVYDFLEDNSRIIRPANYPNSAFGRGIAFVDFGFMKAAVINIMGVVFIENLDCPFKTADKLVDEAVAEGAKIILVDFHAEATSEKRALGYYLDSRVSAVFGTHTHVATADEQILPGGTGYITDLGMTGPRNSVLGVKPELAIRKLKDKLPVRFVLADGESYINGCIFTVDEKTGKTTCVERVCVS